MVSKQPRLVNAGGGGFLLNPPAPAAHPTSFKGLTGFDNQSLSGCPQPSIAPCFKLEFEDGPVDDLANDFLDPIFAGPWILAGGYVEPEAYDLYTKFFPTFISKSPGLFADSVKWRLFYGSIGITGGPYSVGGGQPQTFGERWHLLALPGDGTAPYKVYLLHGVAPRADDLELLPDLPNPDYDPSLTLPINPLDPIVAEYQEEKYQRWLNSFRDAGDGVTFDPLGDNVFRVYPETQDIRRNARLLNRPGNEYVRVSAYWP